jgi:hypothetical protein
MHDPDAMCRGERTSNLDGDVDGLADAETRFLESLADRLAFDKLRSYETKPLLGTDLVGMVMMFG